MADRSTVKVSFLGDASSLAKASRQAQGSIDGVGNKAKRGGGAISGLTKGFVALGAVAGVGGLLKGFIDEAEESRKIGRLTAQVIKTTGGAAKVTAGQVGDLATAISNKTGIDDEAIQSASNLLLTFTNVRNEVGKGNDVFSQATKIATDMGVALGQEPKAAAIQLGKALNDPIKGVTALSKVGVSFTKQQKDQIKTLVKSGNVLGAQKIILSELGREFGGAAEAAATPSQKLAVTMGNLKEKIGTALLPIVDRLANFMMHKVVPAVERLVTQFRNGEGAGGKLREGFERLRAKFEEVRPALQRIAMVILTKVVPVLVDLYTRYLVGVIEAVSAVAKVFRSLVLTVLDVLAAIVGGAAKAFGWVPGLGDKLKVAAKAIADFRDAANAALNGIKKDVNINVKANFTTARLASSMGPKQALAGGTNSARAGLTLVGEEGPELVEMRGGERVHTASATRGLLRGGGGSAVAGGGGITVNVYGVIDDAMVRKIETTLARLVQREGRAPKFA